MGNEEPELIVSMSPVFWGLQLYRSGIIIILGSGHSFLLHVCESHSVVSDSLRPHGQYSPWNSPGQKTGEGSLSLLQGIFPIQESNHDLLHCRFFTTIQLLKSKIWHHLTFNILFNIKKHLTFNTLVLKKLRSWHLVPSLYGK